MNCSVIDTDTRKRRPAAKIWSDLVDVILVGHGGDLIAIHNDLRRESIHGKGLGVPQQSSWWQQYRELLSLAAVWCVFGRVFSRWKAQVEVMELEYCAK